MYAYVTFEQEYLIVNKKEKQFSISVIKASETNVDCSVNVKLLWTSINLPNAGQYQGVIKNVNWSSGEVGIKQAVFNTMPSHDEYEFCDFVLTDFIRCLPGARTKGSLIISSNSSLSIHKSSLTLKPSNITVALTKLYKINNINVGEYHHDIFGEVMIASVVGLDGIEISSCKKQIFPDDKFVITLYGKDVLDEYIKVSLYPVIRNES